ncbi:MFS transporter [Sphingomonas oligophenolica]|uniref:MFS transporter n=1 Tax=Sphingomonas oligophenolica TaxID=301154 RepID=A0A502CKH3_9SPHN|nr:MFS transporter [Sphingomonas oligophenolica]
MSYGFGSVAYGVKDAGFGTFLLIYYNQVIGVAPGTVGLVIMAALVLDAFVDPAIGMFSDRTQSRWGRRHPWMYASALPIAIGWLLLWNPPASLAEPAKLVWLFVTAVVVRSAVSAYEVPSQALTPELSQDYDERTRITAYRYLFGWIGGLSILLLAYRVFLVPSARYPNGLLNADGYHHLAFASAGLMLVAILVSSLGTHREIGRLPKVAIAKQTFGANLTELWDTMHNRGFVILMLAGVCAYTNQGISYALSTYFYNYVWQFAPWALGLLPLALFVGAGVAFVVAPRIGQRTSKPRAAFVFVIAAMLFHTAPYWLRFLGVLPPPGSVVLVSILFPIFAMSTALSVSSFILGASMMADVVEDSQARTGRRNEGVFFAGSFFVQKCTSGIGIAGAGLILFLAHFPKAAKAGTVPVETLDRLTLLFIVVYALLALAAAVLFTRFPFGRAEHDARLIRLAEAAAMDKGPIKP